MNYLEIECRFLEIDKDSFVEKLIELGAQDFGEVLLEETIFYGPNFKWKDEQKFVRLRKVGDKIKLSYKEHNKVAVDGASEIEIGVDDFDKTEKLLESAGLGAYRHQQKKRHTLKLDNVTFDIDTWPKVPTYVELEGESEEDLKRVSKKVGLDWNNVLFHDARWIIENIYNIPVGELRCFTFDRVE